MKPYIKLLVLVFISLHTYSQKPALMARGKFSGRITDTAGLPLAGASIYFPDIRRGATSGADGNFTTATFNGGRYLVEISYTGYATEIATIEINGDVQQNFSLRERVVENEEVTVTGVSSATRLKQSPQPVDVIKRDELLQTVSTNAIDALTKTVPGVAGVSTGPAISKPFIRGLGYNRVVTVNDGIRQEGQQWGDEHGIEIDDYSIQRIEVLKGPASLMYGSDALAGVINIITQQPAPEGSVKANFTSEYETNNKLRGFYGNIGGNKSGFVWNAYGSYKGAEDYKNKYDGYVFNSKFNNKNVGGMLGYGGSWGHSYITASNFNQHLGIVEGERDSATGQFIKAVPGGEEAITTNADYHSVTPAIPFQHIRHFKIASDNVFNIGRSSLDLLVGYQHNQRQEFGNPDDVNTPDAWFSLQTINYAARFHLPYTGNWKTTIGITGMRQTNANKADEVIIPDYNLFDIGGFAYTQYHKDKVTISGGARYDHRHVNGKSMVIDGEPKFSAFGKNFSNVSGSAGLSYEATRALTLKLNIARGFRAPNLAELASNGAHEGTNRYEIGDNNLKSETSTEVDGGIEINSEHVSFEATAYYNHIKDFIFYEKVLNKAEQDSILIDPEEGNELNVFRFAQNSANLYGTELSLDIHPHPLDGLHIKNTFAYTRAQFTNEIDGTKNIPFIPAARLFSDVGFNFLHKGKTLRNLYINAESDYTFKQSHPFTGFNTETATGGYWLVNANIGTDVVSKGKTLFSLYFSGNNLGNVAYQSHLSRLKYLDVNNVTGRQGVFDIGRNYSIKLNVPLSF